MPRRNLRAVSSNSALATGTFAQVKVAPVCAIRQATIFALQFPSGVFMVGTRPICLGYQSLIIAIDVVYFHRRIRQCFHSISAAQ
jgi:hypothetical protein